MRKLTYLTFLFCLSVIPGKAQDKYDIPQDVHEVLVLGNSITYAGTYLAQTETYLRLTNPVRNLAFLNLGLPSETVSGLSEPNHAGGKFPRPDLFERLDRVLMELKPKLILACYGMNDGIYQPFNEDRFKLFKNGVLRLNEKAEATGSDIIWLTPPIYDERKGEAYANVLDIYSDWLLTKKYTDNWKVIDIHWPMKKSLEDHRSIDPDFAFAEDGIHPNALGHWEMAKPIIAYFGETEALNVDQPENAFDSYENGKKVVELITQKQKIRRDAWLTKTGHQRPGLQEGLPINEAKDHVEKLEKELYNLLLEK
ncbi:SGNH/GDSL hydrolase family protein [Jiulongibacter sediminis]|jgi:lysophospholipase L1-like esterase|uniref:SGNH/GDSL hydrolase family protein n=1 Tax=Jiulongibacter sediminis TaxID=1605367 RepID=UPI0026EAE2B2|nr:SGNH/GDSL hydrolase family protein [Jiulongibacter sediminis]